MIGFLIIKVPVFLSLRSWAISLLVAVGRLCLWAGVNFYVWITWIVTLPVGV